MVIAYIPIVLMLVGVLLYAIAPSGKAQEVGRLCFMAGVFALAFAASNGSCVLKVGNP